jgi:negative modulator of initiation of replication
LTKFLESPRIIVAAEFGTCYFWEMVMLAAKQILKAMYECVEIIENLPPAIRPRVARFVYQAFRKESSEEPGNGKSSNVRELVESEEFQSLSTKQEKYLAVLRLVYEADPSKFAKVAPTVKGREREYFAVTEEKVKNSGTSIKTGQISPGGWWADLNNSTLTKRLLLYRLMKGMGYPKADCDLAAKAIR